METMLAVEDTGKNTKKVKNKLNLRRLRISLKYRPEIFRLVVKMRQSIKKKNLLLHKLKGLLRDMKIDKEEEINCDKINLMESNNPDNNTTEIKRKSILIDSSTQTEVISVESETFSKDNIESNHISLESKDKKEKAGWNMQENKGDGKSIADQVKEAAQSVLQQSGMVYVESAGMYYDYKTGYYYNSELGLYYHTDTNCYYYYADDKQEFVFHSYPDRRSLPNNNALEAHERRKARKMKKARKGDEDIDSLSKTLSQDKEDGPSSRKKRKKTGSKKEKMKNYKDETQKTNDSDVQKNTSEKDVAEAVDKKEIDLEDGECSETSNESEDKQMSDSTSTASDDEIVAKHHPPCMRIIVRDTTLPKLKVGTLFLITKDGGTVGREGESHAILLRDHNVSRNHLDIRYDSEKRIYVATDLGSKNGTILNGAQMSESQVVSSPMEVVHGSTIQLGETKLLCHIHSGNDTCGHCEPGLLMETQEKEKAAYTRTCSVQKQHQLELARLKNKYAPEPLMIEDGSYKDRAKERRDTVGSSHHSVKTQSTDVDTFIAPDNKGFKLLEKMGWSKGEGLGKDRQGDTEPIPLVSNEGKAGLGIPGAVGAPSSKPLPRKLNTLGPGTMRLAAKSKLLQPPAKAFTELDDDEE